MLELANFPPRVAELIEILAASAAKIAARRRGGRRPRRDLPDLSHIQRALDATEAWLIELERKYGITKDHK